MANHHKKTTFWQKYRSKYRLTILNDTTFEEVFAIRLSRMNIISVIGISSVIFAVLIFVLVAYTPVREFIPGYPDGETHSNIVRNVYRLDSVEHKVKVTQQYIDNIKTIFNGGTPKNYISIAAKDTSALSHDSISLSISAKDSLFRLKIEQENEFDILSAQVDIKEDMVLFPPIKGLLTNKYKPESKHYGVDIVGKTNQDVFSCYKGVVIYAAWTMETGYVVQIQHPNNLISVYKHLASVSIAQGDEVSTGKQIGKIGDVGTLSTGPHLHFELWKEGASVPPNELINFN
jgi:murein DD-endopeptidase MepM/ murein hydrolase activator NlpD